MENEKEILPQTYDNFVPKDVLKGISENDRVFIYKDRCVGFTTFMAQLVAEKLTKNEDFKIGYVGMNGRHLYEIGKKIQSELNKYNIGQKYSGKARLIRLINDSEVVLMCSRYACRGHNFDLVIIDENCGEMNFEDLLIYDKIIYGSWFGSPYKLPENFKKIYWNRTLS